MVAAPFSKLTIVLLLATFASVLWGALAFGAVYPWAYVPLAWTCAVSGAVALALIHRGVPGTPGLALALAMLAACVALQLVPLQRATLISLSPAADRFLGRYVVGYGIALPAEVEPPPNAETARPLSIDPASTLRGLLLLTAFALFVLGLTRLFSASGARVVAGGLALAGAALAVFAVVQYALSGGETYRLKIYGFWTPMYRGSPFGPFINRNHFAGWMLMVVPLAVAAAYGARSVGPPATGLRDLAGWMSRSRDAGRLQLMALAAAVMALSICISNSRSGMAALGVEVLLLGGLMLRRDKSAQARGLIVAVTTIAVIMVIGWAGIDRVQDRAATVTPGLAPVGGRLGAWRDSVRIIRDFPLTGTGLNTFGTAMIQYQTGSPDQHYAEAHNDYLQLAAEGGLLLAVPIVLVVAAFVSGVRKRFNEAPAEGQTYWIRVGAVVALAGIACQSLVEFSLQMPGNAALFAVIAALALHRSPKLRARGSSRWQ